MLALVVELFVGGLESYHFTSDDEPELKTPQSRDSDKPIGDKTIENVLNNDFSTIGKKVEERKRTIPPSFLMSNKKPNSEKVNSSLISGEQRRLHFNKIEFKTPDKLKARLSSLPVLSSAENVKSSAQNASPNPTRSSSKQVEFNQTPPPHQSTVSESESPPQSKIARVSPLQHPLSKPDSGIDHQAETARPKAAPLLDGSMVVSGSASFLSECCKAQSRVLAIQKGLDDMTAMYRDTIKGRLIRDREELALLGIRYLV